MRQNTLSLFTILDKNNGKLAANLGARLAAH